MFDVVVTTLAGTTFETEAGNGAILDSTSLQIPADGPCGMLFDQAGAMFGETAHLSVNDPTVGALSVGSLVQTPAAEDASRVVELFASLQAVCANELPVQQDVDEQTSTVFPEQSPPALGSSASFWFYYANGGNHPLLTSVTSCEEYVLWIPQDDMVAGNADQLSVQWMNAQLEALGCPAAI
ncbi:hypothetical protein [Humidisolicoccus flavus]|uniref:hypothetical protein n=1 Tax=Humidisolicoccus flavus TaxID=3111414 RepID=UPI003255F3E7